MLIIILGPKGSGKTLLATLFALDSKREVYANYRIEIENFKPLEVIDFIDLPNDVDVFIDEGYTWLESRTSSFFLNRFLSYILWQSRKRTIDIYLTAQRFRALDLRFRDEADIIVKCEPRHNQDKDDFKYKIYWVAEDKERGFRFSYNKAKKVFGFYDTYEIVEPYTKEQLEFKLLESDPEKRWDKATEIGDCLKFKRIEGKRIITHPTVKAQLLKNGFDLSFEPLVYVYLKGLI